MFYIKCYIGSRLHFCWIAWKSQHLLAGHCSRKRSTILHQLQPFSNLSNALLKTTCTFEEKVPSFWREPPWRKATQRCKAEAKPPAHKLTKSRVFWLTCLSYVVTCTSCKEASISRLDIHLPRRRTSSGIQLCEGAKSHRHHAMKQDHMACTSLSSFW